MPRAPSQSSRTATVPVSPEAPLDLDALSAHWRLALNTAQDAVQAAGEYLSPGNHLRRRLVEERDRTARLLDEVAREHQIRLVHRVAAPRPSQRMLGLPSEVNACVFELEGVLTASAAVHAAAWAETFEDLLFSRAERTGERFGPFAPFNPRTDYRAFIQGRPRLDGVRAFLASRGLRLPEGSPDDPASTKTVHGIAKRKNEALQQLLATRHVDAYEGARYYLEAVRDAGLRSAVVSASANTQAILEGAGLARLVDERVDGNVIVAEHLRAWPEPDVLLAACRRLGVPPEHAAVFETEPIGVAAARAGGFDRVVAVERHGGGEAMRHEGADLVVADLRELLDPTLR